MSNSLLFLANNTTASCCTLHEFQIETWNSRRARIRYSITNFSDKNALHENWGHAFRNIFIAHTISISGHFREAPVNNDVYFHIVWIGTIFLGKMKSIIHEAEGDCVGKLSITYDAWPLCIEQNAVLWSKFATTHFFLIFYIYRQFKEYMYMLACKKNLRINVS